MLVGPLQKNVEKYGKMLFLLAAEMGGGDGGGGWGGDGGGDGGGMGGGMGGGWGGGMGGVPMSHVDYKKW